LLIARSTAALWLVLVLVLILICVLIRGLVRVLLPLLLLLARRLRRLRLPRRLLLVLFVGWGRRAAPAMTATFPALIPGRGLPVARIR
jgi:hypothetical protein